MPEQTTAKRRGRPPKALADVTIKQVTSIPMPEEARVTQHTVIVSETPTLRDVLSSCVNANTYQMVIMENKQSTSPADINSEGFLNSGTARIYNDLSIRTMLMETLFLHNREAIEAEIRSGLKAHISKSRA